MNTSDRTSLHETIFWEIRSGPAKDDREMADWVIDLVREAVEGLTGDMTQDHYSAGWLGAMTAVLDLLVKPHPAEPKEPTLLEQYADVLCGLYGHQHEGRPRCSLVPVAERLLALHEAADHPLIPVPPEVEIPPPPPYYSTACGAPWVVDHGSIRVNRVYCTRMAGHEGKHSSGPYCEWLQTCLNREGADPTLACERSLGHEGLHTNGVGISMVQWTGAAYPGTVPSR